MTIVVCWDDRTALTRMKTSAARNKERKIFRAFNDRYICQTRLAFHPYWDRKVHSQTKLKFFFCTVGCVGHADDKRMHSGQYIILTKENIKLNKLQLFGLYLQQWLIGEFNVFLCRWETRQQKIHRFQSTISRDKPRATI